jgi:hypothetical protein
MIKAVATREPVFAFDRRLESLDHVIAVQNFTCLRLRNLSRQILVVTS